MTSQHTPEYANDSYSVGPDAMAGRKFSYLIAQLAVENNVEIFFGIRRFEGFADIVMAHRLRVGGKDFCRMFFSFFEYNLSNPF
jgi:hypothetical protein